MALRRLLLVAFYLSVTACTATYPVVGSFDDYNEVFLGNVNHDLMQGRAFIEVKANNSGVRCTGGSQVDYIPASNYIAGAFLIPYCAGQKGTSNLSCDDGRVISANWTADSCSSGYGFGHDQDGSRFQFAFGMAEQEALARFKQEEVSAAKRPELPVYRPKETRKKIGFSTGTGFLVSPSGHIVTNFHVVEDAKEVTVVADGHEYPASVVTVDSENDVALLKTEVHGTPISIGGRSELSVADEVMTLGYPLVRLQGQALKASFGRVNALSGSTDDPRFIQIDVPIQPGNSGGPLVNEQGQLVGVVTATLNQVVALRETGAIPQNVNYAVKAGYVTPLLQGLELRTSNTAPVGFRELAAEYKNSVFLIIAK